LLVGLRVLIGQTLGTLADHELIGYIILKLVGGVANYGWLGMIGGRYGESRANIISWVAHSSRNSLNSSRGWVYPP
jgi:hypothetical protein